MMSRRRGSPLRFNQHVVGLRNLDREIEGARLIAFRLAEDEKKLPDGEKRLLGYKNESMARRKKEIDEELRMLGNSDKRKRDELMAELKNLSKELESPLERANDHLNRLLRSAKKVCSNASKYLDQRRTTPYSAQDWRTLREEVDIFRRKHLEKRITSSTSISTTPDSKPSENERKKEIDEELRMLGHSDKRKRDELMAELKNLRLELDSPLERTPASSSSTPISTTPDSELLETEMTTPIGADRKEDFRSFPPWTAPWNPEISLKLRTLLEIRGRYLQDNRLEPYFGNFWELACYPMRSKFFTNKARVESLVSDLTPLLESAIPKYPNDLKDVVSGSQLPDIVSLLSPTPGGGSLLLRNHGDEEVVLDGNTFRDKYVLICCFHVPVLWTSCHFQGLINLCEELYSTQDDFEMVMVARMNTLADTEAVFDYFFKGMPSSCLAVPYKDFKRREHICKLLGLDPSSLIYKSIECRFVNPDGSVVRNPFILSKYGADAYPFAKVDMKAVVDDRKEMIYGAKLTQLLKPVDDKDVVCHCYPGSDLQELLGVTEGKHVGLYMCAVGSLIPVLRQVHDECRQNNCNFEIVVLYCPSYDALDPSVHREKMHIKFQMHNVRGWWCLPFNNSVSLRFLEITRFYNTGCWHPADKLIIFGPEGQILDVYGAEVIRSGIGASVIKSHPFTRDAHVNRLKSELQEITLDSLLSSPLRSKTTVITVGELLNRKTKIIIFMDCLRNLYFKNFLYLKDSYIKLKKEHGDAFEVVFFDSSEKTDPATREDYEWAVQKMPWYVYPVDGTRSLSFLKLTETLVRRALFGFGVDGKLCSYESICANQVDFRLTSDTTLFEDICGHFGYTNFAEP